MSSNTSRRGGQHGPGGPDQEVKKLLHRNRAAAFALPHPSRELVRQEMPAPFNADESIHRMFVEYGVFEKCGENGQDKLWRWSTSRLVWEWVQDTLTTVPFGACSHTGVSNLGDGRYTCGNQDCSVRFGRKLAEHRVANDYVQPCVRKVNEWTATVHPEGRDA